MNFDLFQEKLMEFLTDDPNFCVYSGINKNLGSLPDPGKNKRITKQGKLKMLVNTLKGINKEDLCFEEQINYDLATLLLEQHRLAYELEIDNYPQGMRMPVASEIISGPIFMFFINDPRDPKFRLVNIISRLEKVDEFIISYCRNISAPVERWVQMELDKLKGLPDLFQNILDWAIQVEFKNTELLKKVIASANAGLKRYEVHLQNCTKSQSIHLGDAQMQLILDSRGIELSPDEIHRVAHDFTGRNITEVEELRQKLVTKYNLATETSADDLQKYLAAKFKVKAAGEGFDYILKRYEEEREKVLAYVKEQQLFPVMDDQDMHLMNTPAFMRPSIPAGAMMPPMPMREGVKKSLVYLTLTEDLVDEHTEISIPGMMIHEGIPGHHLQYAHAATNPHQIRKVFNANDMAEGWTTMLEDYMLDIGYAGDLEDEIRFSGRRDIARLGARVAIDLFFMSGDKKYLDIGVACDLSHDDPFLCAGNLLQAVTGFVDERVAGELNWYSQEPGYPLSYLTGNHLVWKLKKEYASLYKDELSPRDIDRNFHQAYLAAGNMPVSMLARVVLDK